jgi:hypothetical protein
MSGNYRLSNQLQNYCTSDTIDKNNDAKGEVRCNNLNFNPWLIVIYVLYCLYFYLSALQIKKGLPELMQTYFMMGNYSTINRWIFNIFMNIPFLFELRVFIDWTITKTALDNFQWLKLAQIQADLYKAKSMSKLYYEEKPLGEKIAKIWKYLMGYALIALIVVLIIGPMFLFSNVFTQYGDVNRVQGV